MIPLKEKCSEHVTLWKKLKIEAINWKKKLETLGNKLPSEKLENFNKRQQTLNNKYTEVLKLKEDLDYAELVRVSEGINRYHEKIIQYAKGQYDKYNVVKPVE